MFLHFPHTSNNFLPFYDTTVIIGIAISPTSILWIWQTPFSLMRFFSSNKSNVFFYLIFLWKSVKFVLNPRSCLLVWAREILPSKLSDEMIKCARKVKFIGLTDTTAVIYKMLPNQIKVNTKTKDSWSG